MEGLSGARLNSEAEIGPGLLLMHTGSCGIGFGAKIGHTFTLYQDANVMSRRGSDPPTIGDNVTLYSGARIIGPIHIGDGVKIGANALVMHDLPSNCTALGVPARCVLPGDPPPPYPATAQLRDLLSTMLERGDLAEVQPGTYRDRATGATFNVSFINPDSSEAIFPPSSFTE